MIREEDVRKLLAVLVKQLLLQNNLFLELLSAGSLNDPVIESARDIITNDIQVLREIMEREE